MHSPMAKILIVDDEPQIRRFLRASLSAHDYEVIEADTAANAIKVLTVEKPDLVVLDLGLPDMDGLEVIARVREWSQVPILVLSIRADESDKIAALDRGADDYITKPFGMGELMARMRAALRHRQQAEGEAEEPVLALGDITVDLSRRLVTRHGQAVKLSKKEYELLRVLASHPGKVMTHQQLLREIWGDAYVEETQYLRVYVGQLRQKLEADPGRPHLIVTEPGVGYRLQGEEAPPL
ncbi:response regulator [Novispirillum sp. DQ9]|uniref:response regulator n=1 Tax=Novispirillum sp. DQ9 TaxID=3398612 RepID=UPI003C799F72